MSSSNSSATNLAAKFHLEQLDEQAAVIFSLSIISFDTGGITHQVVVLQRLKQFQNAHSLVVTEEKV